jgi:hypothetical protein
MRFGVALEEAEPWPLQDVEKPRAPGRRRFRAPSEDSSTSSSDGEDATLTDGHAAASSLQLTAKTRQELVTQVERACERKAVQAVTGSKAYKALCQTLQRARQDAEAQLRMLDLGTAGHGEGLDVVREQQQLERQSAVKLQQVGECSGSWRDGGG